LPESPTYDALVAERGFDPLRDEPKTHMCDGCGNLIPARLTNCGGCGQVEDEDELPAWQPPTHPGSDPVRWSSGA